MLEILLVWAASKKIAAMAYDKSYSPAARVGFVIMFIGLWFGGEIIGGVVGVILSHNQPDNFWKVYLTALAGAVIGALLAFGIVAVLPDQGRRTGKRRRKRRREEVDDDFDDDRPRSSRRRRSDEDEDYEDEERPRRRRRRDAEDEYDEDDRPRRRISPSEDEEMPDEAPAKSEQVRQGPPAARDTRLVQCSSCQRKLKIPATLIGKKVKCPACDGIFVA